MQFNNQTPHNTPFPFSGIENHKNVKQALLLCLVDPGLGGVLIMGDKGTGKTTIVRSLGSLMGKYQSDFRLVNLPLGASEDRVLGGVDVEKLIQEKKEVAKEGLLACADNGMLYIDEVNLLEDALVDVLLDAAATGQYRLERDGISKHYKSNFTLVGTMNKEEGSVRPQLLDRFGLSIEVKTPEEIQERTKIIQQRLFYDANPVAFQAMYEKEDKGVFEKIKQARAQLHNVAIPESILIAAATLAIANKVEGLRADIILVKAAKALAAWEGKKEIELEHLHTIAPYVLAHRSKNSSPPSAPTPPASPPPAGETTEEPSQSSKKETAQQGIALRTLSPIEQKEGVKTGKPRNPESTRGFSPKENTVNRYSQYQKQDLHWTKMAIKKATQEEWVAIFKKQKRTQKLEIWVVDSSGSMAKSKAIALVKGRLQNDGESKSQIAMLAIYNNTVQLEVAPTFNKKEVLEALVALPSGGTTPLAEAFSALKSLVHSIAATVAIEVLVFTDGRATGGETEIQHIATELFPWNRSKTKVTIYDTERGIVSLKYAKRLAEQIQAKYVKLFNQEI